MLQFGVDLTKLSSEKPLIIGVVVLDTLHSPLLECLVPLYAIFLHL